MQSFFEPLLKLLKLEKIETDNYVFRLHYKVCPVLIRINEILKILYKDHVPVVHLVLRDAYGDAVFRYYFVQIYLL